MDLGIAKAAVALLDAGERFALVSTLTTRADLRPVTRGPPMLERFPLGDEAGYGFGSVATLNVMQEAMRLAFADRAVWLGDTDAVAGLPSRGCSTTPI